MKYRLKKDSPFAKAGEIIEINISDDYGNTHLHSDGRVECNRENLEMMLAAGYIEEVKPREFYIGLRTNTTERSLPCLIRLNLLQNSWDEIIKVREVIE